MEVADAAQVVVVEVLRRGGAEEGVTVEAEMAVRVGEKAAQAGLVVQAAGMVDAAVGEAVGEVMAEEAVRVDVVGTEAATAAVAVPGVVTAATVVTTAVTAAMVAGWEAKEAKEG